MDQCSTRIPYFRRTISAIVPERDGNPELTATRSRSRAEGQRRGGRRGGVRILGTASDQPCQARAPRAQSRRIFISEKWLMLLRNASLGVGPPQVHLRQSCIRGTDWAGYHTIVEVYR